MEPRCGFESLERAPTASLSTNVRSQREVDVEPIRTLKAPLLILGMHRSGTSVLTHLLSELGLITGWRLNNEESAFFHRLNLYIERKTGGRWDDPEPIARAVEDPALMSRLLWHLRREALSPKVVLYFGLRLFRRYKTLERIDRPWGWKDPRNTFTFDIWRHLFPEARILHIYRHGVDVAASLRARELNSRVHALSRYASARCRTLSGAFRLWRLYVEKAFSLCPSGGQKAIFHVRYEDLLSDPEPTLKRLLEFCGLQPTSSDLRRLLKSVDAGRAFAFRRDPELRAFYERVKDDPWMRSLGYADVE